MGGWRDLAVDCFNISIGTDDKCRPLCPHVFFPIHAFFHPDSVSVDNGFGLVTEERKGQVILRKELSMAWGRIDAHAVNHRPLGNDRVVIFTQIASLGRASGGVILRIKVQHNRLAIQTGKGNGLTLSVASTHGYGGEIRRRSAGMEFI